MVGVIVFTDGEPLVVFAFHWLLGREETTCRLWLNRDLVRIDGERTTKRPPRIYHLPFKVKDRRIQGDGYVCSPKPSAAAVIHMG